MPVQHQPKRDIDTESSNRRGSPMVRTGNSAGRVVVPVPLSAVCQTPWHNEVTFKIATGLLLAGNGQWCVSDRTELSHFCPHKIES